MSKIINVHPTRYDAVTYQWADAFIHIFMAARELGFTLHLHEDFKLDTKREIDIPWERGLSDDQEAYNLYNHLVLEDIKDKGLPTKNMLVVKPTAPAPNYFTIDTLGYAACSSISYEKPNFEETKWKTFFNNTVKTLIDNRENKWSATGEVKFTPVLDVPKDHVLILGQMPGDETVTKMSFGNHWIKLQQIVESLRNKFPIVLKLHPTFRAVLGNDKQWDIINNVLMKWQMQGVKIYDRSESLHDILPHTKVAILENSTAGIECLMHKVPIISYGLPEYHWVTKDLRHMAMLPSFVDDLSWYDEERANQWLAWYCTKYQCYNYPSTLNRMSELLCTDN